MYAEIAQSGKMWRVSENFFWLLLIFKVVTLNEITVKRFLLLFNLEYVSNFCQNFHLNVSAFDTCNGVQLQFE